MAHISDGTLRRMLDDPDAITAPDREHYTSCPECRSRHDAMAEDAHTAQSLLALPAIGFDADRAFARVAGQPAATPRFGFRLPILRPASRAMVGALALAVVVAVVATASVNVIPIFAPKTVTPVPVTLADIQSLPDLSAYGTISWSQQPQPQQVANAAEAKTVTGFAAPTAGTLPGGVSSSVTYFAMKQATGVFTFDAAKAAAAAATKGKTLPTMPAGMDHSTLTLTMGPAVVEVFGDLKQGTGSRDATQLGLPQLIVAESNAPSVTSTGVTVKQLEDYLLAQPGLSPQLAADIRAIGDPITTLPIPVPVQFATSSKVRVQGVEGVALGDNTGLGAAIIWIKGGHVFFVGGTLKQTAIKAVADQLT